MNRQKLISRLAVPLLLAVLAAPAVAQSPRYERPRPPSKNSTVEVRLRYLLTPDVDFGGLGSVPFADSFTTENDLLAGTVRSITYDDGELSQDFVNATLVGGGAVGAEVIPSPNTGATANFVYFDASQVDPLDPGALLFHRYAAAANPDLVQAGANTSSMGWEVNYTRYLNDRRRLGLQVAFSFNGFDSRFNDSVAADLYIKEYRHEMAGDVDVPPLPAPIDTGDGTTTQPPYRGPVTRADVASGNLLEWVASGEFDELLAEGATVESRADLRSSTYNFRAGPVYQLALGRRFAMNLGAGLSAIYYAGQFSAYEVLQNPGAGTNPSRGLTTTDAAEWQVGGYVDASANYRISNRVSLFSGMQVQSGSTYSQFNEEREARVDFSSQVYVHAGLGVRF